jgi:hypothetical protein
MIKNPVVFKVMSYCAGDVRSKTTVNPASAYCFCRRTAEHNYPFVIVLWLKVGEDYMMPLSYQGTSIRDLDKAFQSITFDMSNAEKVCKSNIEKENDYASKKQSNQLETSPERV